MMTLTNQQVAAGKPAGCRSSAVESGPTPARWMPGDNAPDIQSSPNPCSSLTVNGAMGRNKPEIPGRTVVKPAVHLPRREDPRGGRKQVSHTRPASPSEADPRKPIQFAADPPTQAGPLVEAREADQREEQVARLFKACATASACSPRPSRKVVCRSWPSA